MRYSFLIALIFTVAFSACKDSGRAITNASDYKKYMLFVSVDALPSVKHINTDIDFWAKRLIKNPGDDVARVSLAGLYSARFKAAGNIRDIHTSDSLYLVANSLFKTSTSSVYRSLATNCITQHKFQEAKFYLDTALSMGDDKYLTYLMRCDIAMELGDLYLAEQSLKHIYNKNDFDYLVRQAKLLDHKGDLDGAIEKMEIAASKAVESGKDALVLWSKSNLGDMYGHAGRYKESYECYLDVLKIKPDYLYALKGIAWLAFSHDRNTAESKRILKYLSAIHPIPDYDLMLAEIAAYEKDSIAKEELLSRFVTAASAKEYGDMYNKYLFYLMLDEYRDDDKALKIAETEVNNRPAGQSYDLLAWAFYNSGKKDDALKIAMTYVENRNHEPEALYHLGVIYAGTGNRKKARQFLEQANDAAFELGPDVANRVEQALQSIAN